MIFKQYVCRINNMKTLQLPQRMDNPYPTKNRVLTRVFLRKVNSSFHTNVYAMIELYS